MSDAPGVDVDADVSGQLEYRPLLNSSSAVPLALEARFQIAGSAVPLSVRDRHAVHQARADTKLLREKGIDVPVCVRIHTATAEREPQILALLAEIRTETTRPMVEISPASQITDVPRVAKFVEVAHKIGLDVAFDDYGAGSTTTALLHLNADILKLGRHFTRGLMRSPQLRATVSMLLEVAHNAKLRVLAEGVEGVDTWEWLRLAGCDAIESSLVAPPMRIEQVIEWAPRHAERLRVARERGEALAATLTALHEESLAGKPLGGVTGSALAQPAESAVTFYSEKT